MKSFLTVTLLVMSLGSLGRAQAEDDPPQPTSKVDDDGYCDYVQGVASAQSAVQLAPSVFGQFGNQGVSSTMDAQQSNLRIIAGVRYRLSGIYEGFATRNRAKADCTRHRALEQVRGGTAYRALAARSAVLDGAMAEADKLLGQTEDDYKARRISAPEYTATRLRVEELRKLAIETRQQMSALPQPSGGLGGSLKVFQKADAEVEDYEGKLRFAQAFDLSVRFGIDQFVDSTVEKEPFFAVASLEVNIGALFLGGANERAAAGRRRLVRSGKNPLAVDATADRLKVLVEEEGRREKETGALEADLGKQVEALGRIGGDESRRFRLTIWFDWIKVKAEHAYLQTHIAAIKEVLGE
ncbi:MAG: hypothetical protein H0T79_21880 [Deltaproteobacteria bacterium]|nr:hypothetical protein [Deltaproteobacteria bacterium]